MTLTFAGTRGNIPMRSAFHRRHSALLVSAGAGRLLVDCGADWIGRFERLRPKAILVTHAHPDHVEGLKRGAACPVYATVDAWTMIGRWPVAVRYVLPVRRPLAIAGLVVEAWPVQHSLNAPAVGLKFRSRDRCLFYVPDVAALIQPERTLEGVDLYVGDGAVLERSLLRNRGRVLIGHASVTTQLDWCRRHRIPRAIFTHCGSGIVRSDPKRAAALVRSLGRACGVAARLAYDGLTVRL